MVKWELHGVFLCNLWFCFFSFWGVLVCFMVMDCPMLASLHLLLNEWFIYGDIEWFGDGLKGVLLPLAGGLLLPLAGGLSSSLQVWSWFWGIFFSLLAGVVYYTYLWLCCKDQPSLFRDVVLLLCWVLLFGSEWLGFFPAASSNEVGFSAC